MPVEIPYAMAVQAGELIFTCGQCDFDAQGRVLNPGDLWAQTASEIGHLERVLAELDAGLEDLVRLTVFYVSDGGLDEDDYLARIGALLPKGPGPVVVLLPLPYFYYAGMMVEIDAVAMLTPDGGRLARAVAAPPSAPPLAPPFVHGLRCGEMIFLGSHGPREASGTVARPGEVGAQTGAVLEALAATLEGFGAGLDDAVKVNTYYTAAASVADWQSNASLRAAAFPDPGPAATGIPLPALWPPGATIRMELTAMLGTAGSALPRQHFRPEGHWDWPTPMPFTMALRCRDMVFVGGQVSLDAEGRVLDAGELEPQTRASMAYLERALEGFGMGFDEVVKVNTYYRGGVDDGRLHQNLAIRSGHFRRPGPASTGVAVPALAYPGLEIEIEAVAVVGSAPAGSGS
jgi:enamine deaminase RidA (YjgF/YER057c/UK114 family)